MKSATQKTSFQPTGRIWLSALIAVLAWGALAGTEVAASDDSNLKLNSADGSTQFGIQNSGGTDVIMMNSLGGAVFQSSVTVSSNTIMSGTTVYMDKTIWLAGPINGTVTPLGIRGPANTTSIQLQTNAGGNVLNLDSNNSRIGIGNNAPGYTLDVTGSARATVAFVGPTHRPSADSITAIQLQNAAGGTTVLDVDTNNTRIGIANAAPGYTLDVTGSARATVAFIGPTHRPSADSATAIQLQNTAGGTTVLDVDTNNTRIGIANAAPGYTLDVTGSARVSQGLLLSSLTAVKVGAYTALATDYIVRCNSNGGAFAITLPTAIGFTGLQFIVKDVNGTAGTGGKNITVNTTGGQTIDGAATYVISTNYGDVKVFSDGANWFIISHQ